MEPLLTTGMEQPGQSPRRSLRGVLIAGAIVAMLAAAYFVWSSHNYERPAATVKSHIGLGPAEQAYAAKIALGAPELSRSENFLHQEVTTLSGQLQNTGSQSVLALELTVQFSDELHQIAMRESRAVIEESGPPLSPGEQRSFEISFEHVPSSWNMQQPEVRISGLILAPAKR